MSLEFNLGDAVFGVKWDFDRGPVGVATVIKGKISQIRITDTGTLYMISASSFKYEFSACDIVPDNSPQKVYDLLKRKASDVVAGT